MKAISLEKVVNDVEIGCFASENYVWGTWNRRLHLSLAGDTHRALTTRESWTKLADKSWTCSPLWQNVVERLTWARARHVEFFFAVIFPLNGLA